MYEKIPTELKEKAVFCLWKHEANGKVPYQVNGSKAKSTDKKTFTDFKTACDNLDRYDGIGIGIFDGFCAIDIDRCVEDGNISEMAQDIIATMNSYTEYSPSGKGTRIIFKVSNLSYDRKRYYINNRKLGLEVYVSGYTNKFVTITGNVINENDVAECNTELMTVLEKYMLKPNIDVISIGVPGSYLSDDSVISKASASKQGEKFTSLWNGDIPEGKSHSEADQALCNILAFWCGGDIEQMDRLFRLSGLMRDKWERDDYRNATLENAVKSTTEFYKPINISSATEDFSNLADILATLDIVNNSRYRSGDMGFGRLFADVYNGIAQYVPERKKWYVYSGQRWIPDVGSLKVMELAKDLADALLMYTLTIKDENIRTNYLEQCRKWQQRRFREIYLKEAQSIYPVSIEEFDADRYLFNCENGTLDLLNMEFREHRATDKITKLAPVTYEPTAYCERFNSYISEIMSGDTEKAKFLQKVLGYAISGDTRYECMFFLYGATTRNGKGTLMESILKIMGDYGKAVRPETIAQKQNINSQSPSEDIARLAGIRFANISEPSKGLVLNAAQVKSMTGNDTLNARFLNENSFDFKPQFKLYINANYLPVINDTTLFSSGRIIIIPFDRHFSEDEQDNTLKDIFAKAEVQSAILNWLIEGYSLLQKEGLTQPQSVIDATTEYFHDNDKMQLFADDCLEYTGSTDVKTAEVYTAYREWCCNSGCYPENQRNFNQALRTFGNVTRKRPLTGGEKTTLLIGYKLKECMEFLA